MNNDNMIRDIFIGMGVTIVSMFIIAYAVAKIKYPYILTDFSSFKQFYIVLLGFGFFGNIVWYGLFWYLKKEYIQRGVLIITVIASFLFILNKFL